MNTRHYYYDKNKKSNCLDCKYPLINEQGINELVHDSVGKYVYINIYDAEGNYKTHWTYNVAFDGVHPNEDYEKGKETRLQHHTKKICNYIREDYVTYCESKEITDEVMRRELINEWNFGYEFVQSLSSKEVKRIYEMGPAEYDRELEDQNMDNYY
jgi:hypothetical protein